MIKNKKLGSLQIEKEKKVARITILQRNGYLPGMVGVNGRAGLTHHGFHLWFHF